MKIVQNIKVVAFLLGLLSLGLSLTACKDDDKDFSDKVSIERVYRFDYVTGLTYPRIPTEKARLGWKLLVEGRGFATAREIQINGQKIGVNPNNVTENSIILPVPSTLLFGGEVDESVRNTIRIVTEKDDYLYDFPIMGAIPAITEVSHTLPAEGDMIVIHGTDLREITEVMFPGDVRATEFSTNADYTKLTVKVPTGATQIPGAIHVTGANGNTYSRNFMNYREGIFINDFTNDAAPTAPNPYEDKSERVYNYGDKITGTSSELIPATGTAPKNPAYYRSLFATDATAVGTEGGFFFRFASALQLVYEKTAASDFRITGKSNANELALQIDVFVTTEWKTGYLRFRVRDDAAYGTDLAPWIKNGEVEPIRMEGWQTITFPLSAMQNLAGKTLDEVGALVANNGGRFFFRNVDYPGSADYAATVLPDGFKIHFGAVRLVPYTQPGATND